MSLTSNKFNLSAGQLLDIYKSIFSDNGLNLDWLNEDTILEKAAPITTPTERSITLPLKINFFHSSNTYFTP